MRAVAGAQDLLYPLSYGSARTRRDSNSRPDVVPFAFPGQESVERAGDEDGETRAVATARPRSATELPTLASRARIERATLGSNVVPPGIRRRKERVAE